MLQRQGLDGEGVIEALPIDGHVAAVRAHLARHRAAVLTAAPGAGKTTRVPPALVDRGRVIVLQPRRVAVRAVAARIAEERGWTIGREVGWHIRFERTFTADTRLLVVTEGILTARLQQDPLLSDVATIVLDEFHERSLHLDLGLALARQAWLARDDLHLLVMSATLDAAPVARFLDDCPVLARARHAPSAAGRLRAGRDGGRGGAARCCRAPPARSCASCRAAARSNGPAPRSARSCPAASRWWPLHGSLDGAAQDAAVRAAPARRVILATNIAETSLTVPGVSAVVDTGLVKIARYDADRGLDALVTERVTLDSADQRAGRAARLGPGVVRRLWDARDRLRPAREPDIARVDLAGPGARRAGVGRPPRRVRVVRGAAGRRGGRRARAAATPGRGDRSGATPPPSRRSGRRLQRLPVHVRLARILDRGRRGARTSRRRAPCSRRAAPRRRRPAPARGRQPATCSPTSIASPSSRLTCGASPTNWRAWPARRAGARRRPSEDELRRALFTGYADRLARRRGGAGGKVRLASGHGAVLGRESGVRDGEFLVALDLSAAARDGVAEARIHAASRVEPTGSRRPASRSSIGSTPASGRVRAGAGGALRHARPERDPGGRRSRDRPPG